MKTESRPVSFPMDPSTTSIAVGAQWIRDHLKGGSTCPCCTQLAKRYKRKLNSSMAYALVLIYRAFRGERQEWLHVPDYLTEVCRTGPTIRGGDWAKLVHWGLIEPKSDEIRSDGSKRVGFYRITQRGRDFVEGRIRVPQHVLIYAERCMGTSEETTSLEEALKDRFNFRELMDA